MDDPSANIDLEIVDVSSEAEDTPGKNVIASKDSAAWSTDTPGLNDAFVIVKMDRPSKIQTIRVVNNWTALLEIQGERAANVDSGKWETIVAKSSLMTPSDSRSKENGQAERLFTLKSDQTPVVWERIKFICQQPFNRELRFGLTSIQIIAPTLGSAGGRFQLKKKETNGSIRPGDLFAASTRTDEADSAVVEKKDAAEEQSQALETSQNGSTTENQETETNEPAPPAPESSQSSPRKRGRPKKENSSPQPSTSKGGRAQGVKRKKDEEEDLPDDNEEDDDNSVRRKTRRGAKTQDLKGIMKGCVMALSGFVNPLRSELREKMLDMGAKYRPEWEDECTHLICAVAGTPKFNQVRAAGGRIVKKEWIEECYKNKRMMPWRTFMLKPKPTKRDDDADDEEDAKFHEDEEWEPDADESSDEEEFSAHEDVDDLESESSGDDRKKRKRSAKSKVKKPAAKKPKKKSPKRRRGGVHYDDETDEEEDDEDLDLTDSEETVDDGKGFTPRQRPLFRNMHFHLYGEFPDETEEDELKSLITDLAGTIRDHNDELVTHCVTPMKWSPEFEEVKRENPRMHFVTPRWVYDCRDKRTLVDPRLYQLPRNE
ncbi:DNA repair protein XRCC1-like isoform X2 [Paramacrobiotus metropolitanus]|uniref:DNA repair protein XRCC1-like isoform X2 n=1 Tax=Paramacrobiotus metropolitanus TaxID=2943436 RepID=UPI002445AF14|nr:DNA repair protein XRCC1-like isoform X2 [Paramacrobiotus metropolitanus]